MDLNFDWPSDHWNGKQRILVILAHPDDPEFFCGGTLARWAIEGHEIHYVLLTKGEKGDNSDAQPDELTIIRQQEQKKAADIIGVKTIRFLEHADGTLVPSMELRKEMARIIRQERPDILVTCDPTMLYNRFGRLNHPDHRAAGQAVLDSVFPAAGNDRFFPELLLIEHLKPHFPIEVWVSLPASPTVVLDITETWPKKIKALEEHHSQIGDPVVFKNKMLSRRVEGSTEEAPRFEESFRVIKL
jgi:LmbE family N-acetylglucosaminyl deacetylase